MGIFSGSLQYTAYKGTNLLRQEVIAKTGEPSVAYKYMGGLKGFRHLRIALVSSGEIRAGMATVRVRRSREQGCRRAACAKPVGDCRGKRRIVSLPATVTQVLLLTRNRNQPRLRLLQKDSETSFAIGAMQPDREASYRPYGNLGSGLESSRGRIRGTREQLRSLQCASRNDAAHARLLLSEPAR